MSESSWTFVESPRGMSSFVEVVISHHGLAQLLCEYLPHSVHPKCKLLNFLRLRVTCRSVARVIVGPMKNRIEILRHHAVKEVRDANKIIRDSGFMFQMLFCGGRPKAAMFLRMDPDIGIPKGMTQKYWDERQSKKLITGWVRDSGNVLRLQL